MLPILNTSMNKQETNHLIAGTKLAKLIGISPAALSTWDSTKGFKSAKVGTQYDVYLVLPILYKCLKEEELKNKSTDKESSSEKKKEFEAKIKEFEYRELIKDIVPKREYIETEKERFVTLVSGIMELPNRIAKSLGLDPEQKTVVRQDCKTLIERTKETFQGRVKEWKEYVNEAMKVEE